MAGRLYGQITADIRFRFPHGDTKPQRIAMDQLAQRGTMLDRKSVV